MSRGYDRLVYASSILCLSKRGNNKELYQARPVSFVAKGRYPYGRFAMYVLRSCARPRLTRAFITRFERLGAASGRHGSTALARALPQRGVLLIPQRACSLPPDVAVVLTRILGVGAELFLDAKELVVLGQALRAAGRARLDLACEAEGGHTQTLIVWRD